MPAKPGRALGIVPAVSEGVLSISTVSTPLVRPAATRRRTQLPLFRCPAWLRSVPFLSLHVACIAVFFTGVNLLAVVLCGLFYFARMFGITAGYHRYFSHRSYKTSRPFQFFLACLGCCAMQKGPLWWSAHHRHHHR